MNAVVAAGAGLPVEVSYFATGGRPGGLRHDAARWLGLCARRLRPASQTTSG